MYVGDTKIRYRKLLCTCKMMMNPVLFVIHLKGLIKASYKSGGEGFHKLSLSVCIYHVYQIAGVTITNKLVTILT